MTDLHPKAQELWRELGPFTVEEARIGDRESARRVLQHFADCVKEDFVPHSDVLDYLAESFEIYLAGDRKSLDQVLHLSPSPGHQPGGKEQFHKNFELFARFFLLVDGGTDKNKAYEQIAEKSGLDVRTVRRKIKYFLTRFDVQI